MLTSCISLGGASVWVKASLHTTVVFEFKIWEDETQIRGLCLACQSVCPEWLLAALSAMIIDYQDWPRSQIL